MAVAANFPCPDRDKYAYCYTKLIDFTFKDDEETKTDLNLLLDQINSLDYSTVIVSEKDGNSLLIKLCSMIPLYEERLIVKLCQIANLWKRKQMLQLTDRCLAVVTDYFLKALERCQQWARPDILRVLASIFYENVDKLEQFYEQLVGEKGILVQLIFNEDIAAECLKDAVICMQCLTLKSVQGTKYLNGEHIERCMDVFSTLLHKIPSTSMDQIFQCKIVINCLRGVQNFIQVTKVCPVDRIGMLLAAIRGYMFYGLYTQPLVIPDSLYPSPLIKMDIPVLGSMSPTTPAKQKDEKQEGSGQKKSKRKSKKKAENQSGKQNKQDDGNHGDGPDLADRSFGLGINMEADLSGYPIWSKVSSSDSEWSDTEGGQGSRLRSECTKVRQSALNALYWISKLTDKKLMFSYWSSFLPDSHTATNMANAQTLFSVILKDPSPKCRMGALAALSVLVDGTRLLLAAAEDSDEKKTATFTPFSVILGSTIKEIHRCLLLAMVSEDFPITLTQLIKCLGTVIANVPYHRMRPGLLSRIVKQLKHFTNHRDPNVRVACLTCLGSIAGIQPPLMEVCHIIQSGRPPVTSRQNIRVDSESGNQEIEGENSTKRTNSSSQVDVSSSPNITSLDGGSLGEYSGDTTPKKGTASSSGIQTPVFSEKMLQINSKEVSWVVKMCLKNILPFTQPVTVYGFEETYTEPIPVRLESLQVLANLTKGYFPVIRNSVPLLQDLVHKCLCDKDPVIQLHTAKLLDEFTQVLLQDIINSNQELQTPDCLSQQQVFEFWMSLLNGPIQDILQTSNSGSVKATTCDCIANIGDPVFTMLPIGKRVMCLTVVLGLANDEDRFTRASAIRTLGVYVQYKSLREDVSFVSDATSAILGGMEDKNIAVRVKAAWSLANLGDAIAINREEGDEDFLQDFPNDLVLRFLTIAAKACQDNDKVKPNGVRALGNILRYVSRKHQAEERFAQAVSSGVKVLVKCVTVGAMKVRWNACYAISNMYKNTDLNQGSCKWNHCGKYDYKEGENIVKITSKKVDVINVLCSVVKDCKNFKVRINAATALCAPKERSQYGTVESYCQVWDSMAEAFNTAEDLAEFIDFKYRDNLIEQMCLCTLHLISLLSVEDLEGLSVVLDSKGADLATRLDTYYTDKYYMAWQKDSKMGAHLEKANERLATLNAASLSDRQKSPVLFLDKVCRQLAEVSDDTLVIKKKHMPESSFVQVFD